MWNVCNLRVSIVLWIVLGAMVATASGANRAWFIRPVEFEEGIPVEGGSRNALAMRSDGTWPVVAFSSGTNSNIAMMGPTGWQPGPRMDKDHVCINAATSDNGRVGFSWADGTVGVLDRNGWGWTDFGGMTNDPSHQRASLAFNARDMPSVAHNDAENTGWLTVATYNGYSWYQDVVQNDDSYDGFSVDAFALDYDSYGQANVAFSDGASMWFAQKGVATGYQWSIQDLGSMYGIQGAYDMDMVVDSRDMVWVGYLTDGSVNVAIYDPVTLSWSVSGLGAIDGYDAGNFTMTADGKGGVGLAYVDVDGFLQYCYNDGGGMWSNETVMNFETSQNVLASSPRVSVGLAFDADDNPVISYRDEYYGLSLAYDPVVIPEPAILGLLVLGASLIRRRRNS